MAPPPAFRDDLQQLFPDQPPPGGADPFRVQVTDDPRAFREAITAFRARVPMPDPAYRRLTIQQRERAAWVAGVMQADLVADVMQAIDRALAEGTTIADFRKQALGTLVDSWGGEIPGRVATIFRTNIQTAYGAGRYQQLTHPVVRRARPYWQFRGVPDARQSPICKACNGTTLPADDPWWQGHQPPLHYQCRSTVVALSPRDVKADTLTDEPPEAEAQEGFGQAPTVDVVPFRPDPSRYPPAIRDVLVKRLASLHVAAPAGHLDDEGQQWPAHGPASRWGPDDADGDVQLRAAAWDDDPPDLPAQAALDLEADLDTCTSSWAAGSW